LADPVEPDSGHDDATLAEARRLRVSAAFESLLLVRGRGGRLHQVSAGMVSLRLPCDLDVTDLDVTGPDATGPDVKGTRLAELEAGLILALGDAAGMLSVVSALGEPAKVSTLELTSNLMLPDQFARVLEARGQVVRLGRSIVSARIEVAGIGGVLDEDRLPVRVALLQGSYMIAKC